MRCSPYVTDHVVCNIYGGDLNRMFSYLLVVVLLLRLELYSKL